jgi:D-galacturonate reductase
MKKLDVTIVGGGMITNDLLLPSLYHLQRTGAVGPIRICALNTPPLRALKENPDLLQAFPGQDFTPYPALAETPNRDFPVLYQEVIAAMPPRNVVVVAMPDHLHYEVVREALERDQHVLCVKPLVLKYQLRPEEGPFHRHRVSQAVRSTLAGSQAQLCPRALWGVCHGGSEVDRAILLPLF